MVTKNFALTLQLTWSGYQETDIRVTCNDAEVNVLTIEVYDGTTEIDYSEVASGTITFVKDDGNVVQGDLTINAGNITYTMGTNEIAIPGSVRASVQLYGSSDERLTTARFRFYVDEDLISASSVESTTEYSILQTLKTELEAIDVVDLTNDFNSHLAETVDIKSFGAHSMTEAGYENFDNVDAIQAAIDYAYSLGGASVYIPKGIYMLEKKRPTSFVFLMPKSNVTIFGDGDGSVLFVCDHSNVNDAEHDDYVGDYGRYNGVLWNHINDGNGKLSNAVFRDFKIDGNGLKNLVPVGESTLCLSVCIGSYLSENVTIDRVTFANISGEIPVLFGGTAVTVDDPIPADYVNIQNCTFVNCGKDIAGNVYLNDHSSIHARGNHFRICDNNFIIKNEDRPTPQVETAIELHCKNSIVSRNIISNYGVAFIVAGSEDEECNNIIIENNDVKGVMEAVRFYSLVDYEIDNINIRNNTIEQSSYAAISDRALISGIPDENTSRLGNIIIDENYFKSLKPTTSESANYQAILINDARRLSITKNTFENIVGRAIELNNYNLTDLLEISNNTFVDCCKCTTANIIEAVVIRGYVNKLVMDDNKFMRVDTIDNQFTSGIGLQSITLTEGYAIDNIFSSMTIDISCGTAVALFIKGCSGNNPQAHIAPIYGSEIKTLTGAVYVYKYPAEDVNGWRTIYFGSTPPAVFLFVGDECINTTPTELGSSPDKYIIEKWKALTAGGGWTECRTPTGN
jgi:hypothetical protein